LCVNEAARELVAGFFEREAWLEETRLATVQSIELLIGCFRGGGKVLTAGSGGSAADAAHITAELLKSFRRKRPLKEDFRAEYLRRFGADDTLAGLEDGLPAICLCGNAAIMTAVLNDIGRETAFAQPLLSLCRPGDVFLAISTSGNSPLLLPAMRVALAKGAQCLVLTGGSGGRMKPLADTAIVAPAQETYRIQEIHEMLYHLICAAVEAEFYG
jgi:D-sedoheptulose 7-phosphate isomerase